MRVDLRREDQPKGSTSSDRKCEIKRHPGTGRAGAGHSVYRPDPGQGQAVNESPGALQSQAPLDRPVQGDEAREHDQEAYPEGRPRAPKSGVPRPSPENHPGDPEHRERSR